MSQPPTTPPNPAGQPPVPAGAMPADSAPSQGTAPTEAAAEASSAPAARQTIIQRSEEHTSELSHSQQSRMPSSA